MLLLYHQILNDPGNLWAVPVDELAATVCDAHAAGVAFESVPAVIRNSGDRCACALSFDDSYTSVYAHAFPVLAALGVPATVFVPVDHIPGTGQRDRMIGGGFTAAEPMMTWAQLDELARAGWTIESHGCTHTRLDALSAREVEDEIRRSKQVIEDRLGRPVGGFAYPYGVVPALDPSIDLNDLFEAAGYRYAVLAAGGRVRIPVQDCYRIPREPVAPGQRISVTAQHRQ